MARGRLEGQTLTDQMTPADAHRMVGTFRRQASHMGRLDTTTGEVYILHSWTCLDLHPDLRACPFSRSLDLGIDTGAWKGRADRPVFLRIDRDCRLVPVLAGEEVPNDGYGEKPDPPLG